MWACTRVWLDRVSDDRASRGWLWHAVVAVVLLNLADAVFTLWWVHTGVATEANLLLQDLVVRNAVGFAAAKFSLVSLGLLLLWRERRRPLATFGIAMSFTAYNALMLYHLGIAAWTVEQGLA